MSFASRAQSSASRMIEHFGGGKTVDVRVGSDSFNANTGAVSSTSTTDYTFPAVVTKFKEEDIDGTLIQQKDYMVILDTSGATITPTDDDQVIIDSNPLAIKRVLPLKPGDTLATMRLHVEGL